LAFGKQGIRLFMAGVSFTMQMSRRGLVPGTAALQLCTAAQAHFGPFATLGTARKLSRRHPRRQALRPGHNRTLSFADYGAISVWSVCMTVFDPSAQTPSPWMRLQAGFQLWLSEARKHGLHPTVMRRNWLLWGILALLMAGQIPLFVFGPFHFSRNMGVNLLVALICCFAGSGLLLLRYRDAILGHALGGFALMTSFSLVGVGYSYFAASTNMPLQDGLFMAMDKALGFDWNAHMRWVTAEPYRIAIASFGYSALNPQCHAIAPLLVLFHRFHALQVLLAAWLMAMTVTLAIFALVPAVSTFQYLGITEQMMALLPVSGGFSHLQDLEGARAHTPLMIYQTMQGMIAFPSFHAGGAVLLMWAFWQIPLLRWPAVALNALMIAATPVIGSHYLVDVIAGVLMAMGCILLAKKLLPQPA
jgi:hypothetical protein